jgi:hypothetical protein
MKLQYFRFKKVESSLFFSILCCTAYTSTAVLLLRDSIRPLLATRHTLFSALERWHSSPLDHWECSHCAVGGASRLCPAHAASIARRELVKLVCMARVRAEVLGSSVLILT